LLPVVSGPARGAVGGSCCRWNRCVPRCRPGGDGPARGQQKTPWPEAQEVAGERDVAFAVR